MKSGSLRHSIDVERATSTVDALGTPTTAWTVHTTLRAEVKQQSAEEFIRSQGATDERVVIFITRFADVTNADRVMWQDKAHNIREIGVIGHDRGLEIRTVTLE